MLFLYIEFPKTNTKPIAIKKKRTISSEENLEDIIQEYCLKRNKFDPNKIVSPNLFQTKLKYRMKLYYNSLCKFSSSPTK